MVALFGKTQLDVCDQLCLNFIFLDARAFTVDFGLGIHLPMSATRLLDPLHLMTFLFNLTPRSPQLQYWPFSCVCWPSLHMVFSLPRMPCLSSWTLLSFISARMNLVAFPLSPWRIYGSPLVGSHRTWHTGFVLSDVFHLVSLGTYFLHWLQNINNHLNIAASSWHHREIMAFKNKHEFPLEQQRILWSLLANT